MELVHILQDLEPHMASVQTAWTQGTDYNLIQSSLTPITSEQHPPNYTPVAPRWQADERAQHLSKPSVASSIYHSREIDSHKTTSRRRTIDRHSKPNTSRRRSEYSPESPYFARHEQPSPTLLMIFLHKWETCWICPSALTQQGRTKTKCVAGHKCRKIHFAEEATVTRVERQLLRAWRCRKLQAGSLLYQIQQTSSQEKHSQIVLQKFRSILQFAHKIINSKFQ